MDRKLIAFDVDGTLISYKNETYIPSQTIAAIEKLKEKGHIITLATGRSFLAARPIMNQLGIHHAVLHNGAQIVLNNESFYEKKIGKRTSLIITKALLNTSLCVFAFDGENVFANNASEESKKYIIKETGINDIIKQLCDHSKSLFSINLYGESSRIFELLSSIKSIVIKKNQFEISAKGISKSNGIKRLAKQLHISKNNIIAVGDGLNDIDMIKMAGIGIAVGNACQELKNVANMITDDIEFGGILKAFEELKLI